MKREVQIHDSSYRAARVGASRCPPTEAPRHCSMLNEGNCVGACGRTTGPHTAGHKHRNCRGFIVNLGPWARSHRRRQIHDSGYHAARVGASRCPPTKASRHYSMLNEGERVGCNKGQRVDVGVRQDPHGHEHRHCHGFIMNLAPWARTSSLTPPAWTGIGAAAAPSDVLADLLMRLLPTSPPTAHRLPRTLSPRQLRTMSCVLRGSSYRLAHGECEGPHA